LQTYIDSLSKLLLESGLRDSKQEDEVRKVARVKTLTVLSRLDDKRKRILLQFLHEATLISQDNPIIDLQGIDLSGSDLSGSNLSGDKLADTNLSGAKLNKACLMGTNLAFANLSGAEMREALLLVGQLTIEL